MLLQCELCFYSMNCLQHGWIFFRLQTLISGSDCISCRKTSTQTELNKEQKVSVFTFQTEYNFAVAKSWFLKSLSFPHAL